MGLKKYIDNWKNVKKNYNKVKASPFASLNLAYKFRIIIVSLTILLIIYIGYGMIKNFQKGGWDILLSKFIMIGMLIYICYKIYSTIPQAKAQIEYYKKYPHLINYCPTNTKETVDSILQKIEDNKLNSNKEDKQNDVRKKETTNN